MARFAPSGSEANAIAIRIARAATGRDTVAICGYHGWHDCLATNLQNESGLKEHLLPGLEPNGVPQGLAGVFNLSLLIVLINWNRSFPVMILLLSKWRFNVRLHLTLVF